MNVIEKAQQRMTDYNKLVEALRYCEFGWSAWTCDNCEYSKTDCQLLLSDAADAIEALQAELPKRGEWIGKSENDSAPIVENQGWAVVWNLLESTFRIANGVVRRWMAQSLLRAVDAPTMTVTVGASRKVDVQGRRWRCRND